MNASTTPDARSATERQPHPSPHRARVGLLATWFGILGAPVAWSLQELVNFGLSSYACYPHDAPLTQPLWAQLTTITYVVEAIALLIGLAAGATAWRNWRRSRTEKDGNADRLLGGGDGRTRFMAMVGMLTSGLFLVGIVFATLYIAGVPACGG